MEFIDALPIKLSGASGGVAAEGNSGARLFVEVAVYHSL